MSVVDQILSAACLKAQVLTSAEAELAATPPRWIFEAPTFKAGGGDYVVIHKADWESVMAELRAALGNPAAQKCRNLCPWCLEPVDNQGGVLHKGDCPALNPCNHDGYRTCWKCGAALTPSSGDEANG